MVPQMLEALICGGVAISQLVPACNVSGVCMASFLVIVDWRLQCVCGIILAEFTELIVIICIIIL